MGHHISSDSRVILNLAKIKRYRIEILNRPYEKWIGSSCGQHSQSWCSHGKHPALEASGVLSCLGTSWQSQNPQGIAHLSFYSWSLIGCCRALGHWRHSPPCVLSLIDWVYFMLFLNTLLKKDIQICLCTVRYSFRILALWSKPWVCFRP